MPPPRGPGRTEVEPAPKLERGSPAGGGGGGAALLCAAPPCDVAAAPRRDEPLPAPPHFPAAVTHLFNSTSRVEPHPVLYPRRLQGEPVRHVHAQHFAPIRAAACYGGGGLPETSIAPGEQAGRGAGCGALPAPEEEGRSQAGAPGAAGQRSRGGTGRGQGARGRSVKSRRIRRSPKGERR